MSAAIDLNLTWFLLVGLLLTGYAILDGFDLGVGMLLLFVPRDDPAHPAAAGPRRILLNAIGPVWDGNEVWLVVGGGALFAAFPEAYATVFSGFYLPLMTLLAALVFRAVAIEFRSREPWPRWRQTWDVSFCLASFLIAFVLGVALGNIIRGIPLGPDFEYRGGLLNLLSPYALVTGLTTAALFMLHGAIYLVIKTGGSLQAQIRGWAPRLMLFFLASYLALTAMTIGLHPAMLDRIRAHAWLTALPLVLLLSILAILRQVSRGRETAAFAASCAAIALLMALFGLGLYPTIVPSDPHPEYSLTVTNAASSPMSLRIMFTMALIGMPFVVAYTCGVYWVFRGKVNPDRVHY